MTEKAKVVGKHIEDCYAVKMAEAGVWNTCWGPPAWGEHGEPIARTTRRYGKTVSKTTAWLRFVCNCSRCHAELHVPVDLILEEFAP